MDDKVIKWKGKTYKQKGHNQGFLDQKVPKGKAKAQSQMMTCTSHKGQKDQG